MRLQMIGNVDFNENNHSNETRDTVETPAIGSDLLFLGFHGYGNDESEMVRIIEAIYGNNRNAHGSVRSPAEPNYLSFRATYARPYVGGNYWYPDGCGVDERRHECNAVGNNIVRMMQSPVFQRFHKILIGFSQGAYLSYRMVMEHPEAFDGAILLSPSFKGESDSLPIAGNTRFALCYGSEDHTIPVADQQCARDKLNATGNCTYFEYPGMAHAICDQEITDLRTWLGLW